MYIMCFGVSFGGKGERGGGSLDKRGNKYFIMQLLDGGESVLDISANFCNWCIFRSLLEAYYHIHG